MTSHLGMITAIEDCDAGTRITLATRRDTQAFTAEGRTLNAIAKAVSALGATGLELGGSLSIWDSEGSPIVAYSRPVEA